MKYTTNKAVIYDIEGKIIADVKLPEYITPIPSKRTGISESGLMYKGAGIVYQKHLSNDIDLGARKIGDSGIIYEKYVITYPHLIGKYGIFKFRHQPIFDDMEGGCGTKELKMVDNMNMFEMSAVKEIVNIINIGFDDANVYVYNLKEVNASPLDVVELIEYVLCNNFNTAWDKNLWSDIYCYKYVRDIADWYKSEEACHKLGTVYALLHSLYVNDIYLYIQLIMHLFGEINTNKLYVIYYSGRIVNKFCKNKININLDKFNIENYSELLRLLFDGKACCHLMDDRKWNWVREYYYNKIDGYLKVARIKLDN